MQLEILDWGCRIINLRVPNQKGDLIDTTLTYKDLSDYLSDPYYLGCTVGRYANRIAQGKFSINDKIIQLSENEISTKNHIHGGFKGFDKKYWTLQQQEESRLILQLQSPHNEEGYPGSLRVEVTYELLENLTLRITYKAQADQNTAVNLTNHSYFNLADQQLHTDTHEIQVMADYYSPLNEQHLPTAPFKNNVADTIYDLREFRSVQGVQEDICNMNYFLPQSATLQQVATIREKVSGRQVSIATDYPAAQLYFGNFLSTPFSPCQGICFEPHYAPNSPNIIDYPAVILQSGEIYHHIIEYQFANF